MARKTRRVARRSPTQARAQATVDAVLRATAQLLRTQGFEACTTNAVAKRAGVSIGSLYQYFSSKEELVAALAEAHAAEGYALLARSVAEAPLVGASLEDTVRHYIRAMVRLHAADPQLHRVLMENVPGNEKGVAVVRRVSEQAARLVRAWLEANRARLRKVDLDAATYVLVTAVEAVTHLPVLEKPKGLDEDALVRELSELVLRYLGLLR